MTPVMTPKSNIMGSGSLNFHVVRKKKLIVHLGMKSHYIVDVVVH